MDWDGFHLKSARHHGWGLRRAIVLFFTLWSLVGLVWGGEQEEHIAVLESDAPLSEKARSCEELARVGGRDAVAPLAKLLGDPRLGDYARLTLQFIADDSVDEVFREALRELEGRLLIGVINSIGIRGDVEAVPALQRLVRDEESLAAVAALGQIGNEEAVETILHQLSSSSGDLRAVAGDACLVVAEEWIDQGRTKEARDLYDRIRKADVPDPIRSAATYGAIVARGEEAGDLLVKELTKGNPSHVQMALRAARELPGDQVTKKLIKELERSRPSMQALLIKVLADRGDEDAYECMKKLAERDTGPVCVEAMKALGRIGDASVVPVLAVKLEVPGEIADTAAAALQSLEAEGVDGALTEMIETARGRKRVELIEIVTSRGCKEARPALLRAALSEREDEAAAAFKGLTVLAEGEDVAPITDLLVQLKSEASRPTAENAVVAAARKMPHEDTRADAVLSRYRSEKDVIARSSLLRVLGRIANEKAFHAVKRALRDEDEKMRDVAVRALAAWPDPRALDALSCIWLEDSSRTHRVLALRGFLRLLEEDTTRSPAERVAAYALAMRRAEGTEERKLVLTGLSNMAHPDALEMALACLEKPELTDEAVWGAFKVAQRIAGACPRASREAALKVAEMTEDAQIQAKAKTLAETIGQFEDFIVGWQVAGPYVRENWGYRELYKTAFGPEEDGTEVAWSVMPAGTDPERPWLLDLLKLWAGEQRVAYARTWVRSEKPMDAVLETGSDDGIKVWLNGEQVQSKNVARAAVPASDKARIDLRAGWNEVLVKVTQNVLGWEFCVRIVGTDGGRLEGLEVDCLHGSPASLHKPMPGLDGAG